MISVYMVSEVIAHSPESLTCGAGYVQVRLSNGVTIEPDDGLEYKNIADKNDSYYLLSKIAHDENGKEKTEEVGYIRADDYFANLCRYWELRQGIDYEIL